MITPDQRQRRRKYLGSSDSAAIIGKDPWRTAGDVWLEKTGQLPPDATDAAKTVGTYLEPSILNWAEDQLETTLTKDASLVHPNGILAANLDAAALGLTPAAIIEAKSVGMLARPEYYAAFGPAETDMLPDHIIIQAAHQSLVANAQPDWPTIEVVIVPVLIVGRGFVMYRIPRDIEFEEKLCEAELKFHRNHVVAGVPPPAVPTLEHLRWRTREVGKSVALDPTLVDKWQAAKADREEMEQREEHAKAALLYALGDAEVGITPRGQVMYRESKRAAYSVKEGTVRKLSWKGIA